MRLTIENNIEYMATNGVAQGCSTAGITGVLASIIIATYKNVMQENASWGDHFIWESDSEAELKEALAILHKSIITNNAYQFNLFKDEYPDFLNGDDKITDTGSNSSNGMSETAPIDAILDNITTPNAKSKASGSYSNSRTEQYYRNKKDAFIFAMKNNLYTIMKNLFEPIVHEHNNVF